MNKIVIIATFSYLVLACSGNNNEYDASGTFEAIETIVPAETNGIITSFNIIEGQRLDEGIIIGQIDTIPLFLKKKQLEGQIKATGARKPNIIEQTAYYKKQEEASQSRLDYLIKERKRIQNLIKADAATTKQLDDINIQIEETQKQILIIQKQNEAQVSALKTQNSGLQSDVLPLTAQIDLINYQLAKSKIINPVHGTVLTKYAESKEMAVIGKPLYKIADLSALILRAYITGDQFAKVKIGQAVTIMVDNGEDGYKKYVGTVEWISDKAEFTPKTIQTKDERANLVYAVKIRVKNDGYLKIGMYGEVILNTNGSSGTTK